MEELLKTLGQRIAYKRRALGWSQTNLAEKAGCTQQTISNAETDKTCDPRDLGAIAEALQVSAAWLEYGGAEFIDSLDEYALDLAQESMHLTPEQRRALLEFAKTMRGRVKDVQPTD